MLVVTLPIGPLPGPPRALDPIVRDAGHLGAERDRDGVEAERAAFEARMVAAWPQIARLVERLLGWPGRASDVDDVVQDVFLAAWQRRAQFRGDAKWTTWVHAIAVRRAQSAARSRDRRQRWFGLLLGDRTDEIVVEGHAGEQELGAQPSGESIRRVLARLRPADREVLVLRYLEGLDAASIMEQLGITRAAFDVRMSRARDRFRKQVPEAAFADGAEPALGGPAVGDPACADALARHGDGGER